MSKLKRTKQTYEIEYDSPYPECEPQGIDNISWLCPDNLKLLLNQMKRFGDSLPPHYKVIQI